MLNTTTSSQSQNYCYTRLSSRDASEPRCTHAVTASRHPHGVAAFSRCACRYYSVLVPIALVVYIKRHNFHVYRHSFAGRLGGWHGTIGGHWPRYAAHCCPLHILHHQNPIQIVGAWITWACLAMTWWTGVLSRCPTPARVHNAAPTTRNVMVGPTSSNPIAGAPVDASSSPFPFQQCAPTAR